MGNPKKAKLVEEAKAAPKPIKEATLPGRREKVFMLIIRLLRVILKFMGKKLIKHRAKRLTRKIEGKK